jgi:hypothetical protein
VSSIIDTRTGAAPGIGRYRMDVHDVLFGVRTEYVEVTGYWRESPATGEPHASFWYRSLSGSLSGAAHLVGDGWYRVFTPTPPITSPAGSGLL